MAKQDFPQPPSMSLALIIDLDAIAHNYLTICAHAKKGTLCAAVLKANAYGMGVKEVAHRLYKEGCRHYFMAHLSEAIEVKNFIGKDASIYVLNGLRKGDEEVYVRYHLTPVLSDMTQIQLWNAFSKSKQKCLKAVLHFDTGMVRTGLSLQAAQDLGLLDLSDIEIVAVMSHLACTYQPSHPMNEVQRIAFDMLSKRFPFAMTSFANSGAVFLGSEYQYNLARIGLALTGCRSAIPYGEYKLKPALKAYAQVLQINEIARGESVGYDAAFIASRASRIATIGVGYADGYLRSLSKRGEVYYEGQRLPVVGKVSMDLTTIDVTDVPPHKIRPGDWVELFGENLFIDELAEKAETISWELFTRLGHRFERFYLNSEKIMEAVQ